MYLFSLQNIYDSFYTTCTSDITINSLNEGFYPLSYSMVETWSLKPRVTYLPLQLNQSNKTVLKRIYFSYLHRRKSMSWFIECEYSADVCDVALLTMLLAIIKIRFKNFECCLTFTFSKLVFTVSASWWTKRHKGNC